MAASGPPSATRRRPVGGACRSYTLTTVYSAKPKAGGGYTFTQSQQWVFNNIVLFRQ